MRRSRRSRDNARIARRKTCNSSRLENAGWSMRIRAVEKGDSDGIARVHEHALPWSINGRLGYSHLKGMYDNLLLGPDCLGFVAIHSDEIIAFQVSTTDWESARKRLADINWLSKLKV